MSYPIIPRTRFTEKMCKEFVDDINERLSYARVNRRMEVSSCDNYFSIDVYSPIDRLIDGGYLYVLVSGTLCECAESARGFFYIQMNKVQTDV